MPITRAEVVEALVNEAMDANNLKLGGISGDLNNGVQPYGFAARQLLVARKGEEEISREKLIAIAERLSGLLQRKIFWEDLVHNEADGQGETTGAAQNVTQNAQANEGGTAFNANNTTINIGRP